VVNAASIAAGSLLGLVLKKGVPDACKTTVTQGLSLCVMVLGLQMALKGHMLILVSSIALGGLIGEFIALDSWLDRAGRRLARLAAMSGGAAGDKVREGFITATLVYCVGAMSVVGSLRDGLAGDSSILFIKSLLDGVMSIFLASSLGVGVLFSALPVFIYQGLISLAAGLLSGFLSEKMIVEMSAAGGVLIFALGFFLLKLLPVKVANLLPAMGVSVVLTWLWVNFSG
jgi:uncharacterized membrane protein YqgA involved in biofilm formation